MIVCVRVRCSFSALVFSALPSVPRARGAVLVPRSTAAPLLPPLPSPHPQMCDAKQTAAAEGPVASHTRRQTEKRTRDDDTEEEKQPAQSSTHVSPAMRLYRHALESIFAMLELKDLSRVLAVSRSWSSAVCSMKPAGVTFERNEWQLHRDGKPIQPLPADRLSRLLTSPLTRHIATMIVRPHQEHPFSTPLTNESLALMAQHAPNLTSLECSLSPTPQAPWSLPAKLQALHFDCSDLLSTSDANALFICVSGLPSLDRLCLSLVQRNTAAGVDFSLLAAAPSLTDFTFQYDKGMNPWLSEEQVAQIRTTLGHLRRISVHFMDAGTLARFLQPPVTARWQDIGHVWLDEPAETLLVTLPSQTRLWLLFVENRPHANFLSQLPQLKALSLWCNNKEEDSEAEDEEEQQQRFFVPPAAMLNSLLRCTGLTELTTDCGFHSAQWTALFVKLTALTKLTINGGLESLACFAVGPVTQSLDELAIAGLNLPPSELVHLHGLKRLRSLRIDGCFDPPLDAATIGGLFPPTQRLPLLTEFACHWRMDRHKWSSVKRKGPSFEWMQQRLTHVQ